VGGERSQHCAIPAPLLRSSINPQAEIMALPSVKAVYPATTFTQKYLNFKGLKELYQENVLFVSCITAYCSLTGFTYYRI